MIFLIVLILFLHCVALTIAVYLCISFFNFFRGDAPFISVRKEIITDIISALALTNESRMYELGAGNGKVTMECYKVCPDAHFVGIEKDRLPLFFARRRWKKAGKSNNVSFIYKNFYDVDLSNATHIYIYLLNSVLDDLLPKFEKELQRGAKVVSCDFVFSKRQPSEIIKIGKPTDRMAKTLNVYTF